MMKKIFALITMLLMASGLALAEPYAFPVPFVETDPPPTGDITFTELPNSGTIQILTVAGEEVRKLDIPQGANVAHWDLKNTSGKRVATGIYLYLVEGDGQQTTGKLVVIR